MPLVSVVESYLVRSEIFETTVLNAVTNCWMAETVVGVSRETVSVTGVVLAVRMFALSPSTTPSMELVSRLMRIAVAGSSEP